ncbi:MAG: hypothetical protein KF900_00485 [Bacteroidetes bacterium]|nr:hypothetical protein [Bacteroidota bacterium]
MEEVIHITRQLVFYLNDLVDTLYKEEYFGFEESAHEYVERIRNSIYTDLAKLTHHEAPAELKRYGKYYVKIKGSKRTMWYVFFDKIDNRYIVGFITNNHVPQGAYFNKF